MGRRLGGKTRHIFLAFQNPEILINGIFLHLYFPKLKHVYFLLVKQYFFLNFFTVLNIAVIVKIMKFLHIMPKNLNIFACNTMSKAIAPRLYVIVL